jgi:DNA polymerase-4
LRGKPLLIGHDGPRGVVSTASYEARPFGCRSAMPMVTAKRLCPQATVLPVRGDRYREISRQVFVIFDEFSPVVEPVSIDEAFLDLTGTDHLFGSPVQAARELKRRIRQDVGITGSVGVSYCKYLAKLGSDFQKPDGLTMIGRADVERVLPPLPVTRLWGVGKATAARMEAVGIRTIGDVRARGEFLLRRIVGSDATRLWELAQGIDERPVVPDRDAKSIGHETTFEEDVADPDEVRRILLELTEGVGMRLRSNAVRARGVSVKIRFGAFTTITRSVTLREATDVTREIWESARTLFEEWAREFVPVRLIGVTADRLESGAEQLNLFADPGQKRQKRLDALTDQINRKFGKQSIRRGGA